MGSIKTLKKKQSSKNVLLEHSQAKVELYRKYLSIYLNILSRVPYVKKIFIYDLLCGEGQYADGNIGSPIAALEAIKEHYFSNGKKCPNIEIWFNDYGKSEVEEGKSKIERVEELSKKIYKPSNVNRHFTCMDFTTLIKRVSDRLKKHGENEKALLLIDPFGYKEITPEILKEFLFNKNTELILFLPASHMYRFANKTLSKEEFSGGEPLKKFLESLFPDSKTRFSSVNDFIEKTERALKEYLVDRKVFVRAFCIERDSRNAYSLFFFSHNVKGYKAMLNAMWGIDKESGRRFQIEKTSSLFNTMQMSDYPEKLKQYIKERRRSNKEILVFGLDNGYLPKHSVQVLKEMQAKNPTFTVEKKDGSTVTRRGAFYIEMEGKTVYIYFK